MGSMLIAHVDLALRNDILNFWSSQSPTREEIHFLGQEFRGKLG